MTIRVRSRIWLLAHVVWCTKHRNPLLVPEHDDWLCGFIDSTAAEIGVRAIAFGNAYDHVHVLLAQAPTVAFSETIRLLKGRSSHAWTRRGLGPSFAWQDGYWAQSIGPSSLDQVRNYLLSQRSRHAQSVIEPWEEPLTTSAHLGDPNS